MNRNMELGNAKLNSCMRRVHNFHQNMKMNFVNTDVFPLLIIHSKWIDAIE